MSKMVVGHVGLLQWSVFSGTFKGLSHQFPSLFAMNSGHHSQDTEF